MKSGCEGFVGTHQLEVGDREERALCSGQRDQHVQKLRWERTKFMCSSARFRVCWGWKSVLIIHSKHPYQIPPPYQT